MSYSKAKIDVFKKIFFESISGISPNSNIFSRLLPKPEKYNRKIFFKLSSRVECVARDGRDIHIGSNFRSSRALHCCQIVSSGLLWLTLQITNLHARAVYHHSGLKLHISFG